MENTTDMLRRTLRHLRASHNEEQYGRVAAELESVIESIELEEKTGIDFKAIMDASSDGVYVVDKDCVIRYINPAYARYTCLKPEDLLGKTSQELVNEGIFKKVATPEVLKSKRQHILLGYVRTVEDRDIFGYCIVNPILDEDGEVRYAVVTLYDPERLKARYSEFAESNDSVEPPIRIREGLSDDDSEPVIGNSDELKRTYTIAEKVAHTDATVLICGESGVGKEGVANFICANSPRKSKPFVKINCTAIPSNLLESELFGYERGAFTGANSKGKAGLLELADGGSILLDEIGDLPVDLQAKLLRVIQTKEFMRIGGTTPIKLDIRIIASTNANLQKKMLNGEFREDLYYRISAIPINVPPLRERREDIPLIIRYYLDYFCLHHHRAVTITDVQMSILQRYDWPGNIRQLKNVVEYMVVCGDEYVNSSTAPLLHILGVEGYTSENNIMPSLEESMSSYEKKLVSQAINSAGGLRKAAAALGVDPATLSRKAKKYGIELPKKDSGNT